MTAWVTIEHIELRGGPYDEDEIRNVGSAGLLEVVTVETRAGSEYRYRKSGAYSQLRGEQMAEPYARIWFYDWLPDSETVRTCRARAVMPRCGRVWHRIVHAFSNTLGWR